MIFDVLNKKAAEGWKLHTIYSNEIGKNVIAIAGAGTNRTISEDIMVFERRIR
jgi:hypothetical protein